MFKQSRSSGPAANSEVLGTEYGRSRIGLIAALGLLLLLVLLTVWFMWQRPPQQPRQNVVLVLIDTLRADTLGCYGNPLAPTPHIDGVAAGGVRFDQAIASSSWTLPSVASLLTGTWPTIHGGLGKKMVLSPIREELPTAAEVLAEAGFSTYAFTNAAFLSPLLRLDRGFDIYDHMDARNDLTRRADEAVSQVLGRLRAQHDESNFVLLHLFDPHLDYDPPPGYETKFTGGRVRPEPPLSFGALQAAEEADGQQRPAPVNIEYIEGVYLGEVNFVDAQVGRLVDGLEQLGLFDNTTLIITSDHGEEFWEHGSFEHGHTLYDELIRVPLIIKTPATISPVEQEIDLQVRGVDIMPTVFSIAGVAQPESFVGSSLLPLMLGEPDVDRPAFSEATLYGKDMLSWRTTEYKLIYDMNSEAERRVELYDIRNDPGETRDLFEEQTELAERLYGELEEFVRALVTEAKGMSELQPISMSPANMEELRSLGYLR